jgi:hypothetical protein
MNIKRRLDDRHGKDNNSARDQAIHVLSLEYQTLRDEMIMRMSSRFQFLGFMTAAAAVLATIIDHSVSGLQMWVIVGLAVTIFLFGVTGFFILGRHLFYMSARVAEIEQNINEMLPPQPGVPSLLGWESERQGRTLLERLNFGMSRRPH